MRGGTTVGSSTCGIMRVCEECSSCAAACARFRCGRCRGARYCSRECQRKHWTPAGRTQPIWGCPPVVGISTILHMNVLCLPRALIGRRIQAQALVRCPRRHDLMHRSGNSLVVSASPRSTNLMYIASMQTFSRHQLSFRGCWPHRCVDVARKLPPTGRILRNWARPPEV